MLLNVNISDDLSRVMAVSANRKAQAGKLHQREHRPLIRAFLNSLKKVTIMQSSIFPQIQDVQSPSEQGFCAVVHEPTAYLADIDVHSCTARSLGIYPSHAAAVAACQSFIASLSDDLKAWAAFSVTTAEQIN